MAPVGTSSSHRDCFSATLDHLPLTCSGREAKPKRSRMTTERPSMDSDSEDDEDVESVNKDLKHHQKRNLIGRMYGRLKRSLPEGCKPRASNPLSIFTCIFYWIFVIIIAHIIVALVGYGFCRMTCTPEPTVSEVVVTSMRTMCRRLTTTLERIQLGIRG